MNSKYLIYISSSLAVLLIVGLGWFFAGQKQNQSNRAPQPANISSFRPNQKLTAEKINIADEKNGAITNENSINQAAAQNDNFSSTNLSETTKNLIQKYLASAQNLSKNNLAPPSSTTPTTNITNQPADGASTTIPILPRIFSLLSPEASPKKQMTEAEIFNALYPQFYRDYLNQMQDLMITKGYLRPDQKSDFSTKEKIFSFWKNNIDFWISNGVIDSAKKDNYLAGLEELSALNDMEADSYRQLSLAKQIKHIAQAVINFFKPAPALAVDVCAGIYGYRDPIASASSVGGASAGYNLVAPCCNCKAYNQDIGCLNRMCSNNSAVIFDQTTFICGCSAE